MNRRIKIQGRISFDKKFLKIFLSVALKACVLSHWFKLVFEEQTHLTKNPEIEFILTYLKIFYTVNKRPKFLHLISLQIDCFFSYTPEEKSHQSDFTRS